MLCNYGKQALQQFSFSNRFLKKKKKATPKNNCSGQLGKNEPKLLLLYKKEVTQLLNSHHLRRYSYLFFVFVAAAAAVDAADGSRNSVVYFSSNMRQAIEL